MNDSVMTIIWIVSFVLVAVTVTGFARRVGWSAPIALVAVGALASFIPALPRIEVRPELVLYGLLPPLLFAAAIRTSLVDVRARRDSILALSVGLVLFTVVVVGFFTWLIVPRHRIRLRRGRRSDGCCGGDLDLRAPQSAPSARHDSRGGESF